MNRAEAAFYANKFREAVSLYDKVLNLVPDWQRALDHRKDAEKYLKEGVPPDALPEEAGIHWGKAQSAVRVKDYGEARRQLDEAWVAVKAAELKWNDGLKFGEKLDILEAGEKKYQAGLTAFKNGDLEQAIENADTAFTATADNKYKNEADKWRTLQSDIANFNIILTSGSPNLKMISETKAKLEGYLATYGEIKPLVRARSLLELKLPNIVEMVIGDINGCKSQVNNCSSISEGITLAKQAQQLVKSLVDLGSTDDRIPILKRETDHLAQQFNEYDNTLNSAIKSADDHHRWPAEAWELSAKIRRRFSHNSRVSDLASRLTFYNNVRNLGIGALFVVGVLVVIAVIWLGTSWVTSYIHSLTPTPTLTPTQTITLTPVPTNTPIPTSTLTPLPTLTPTPTVYTLIRAVYMRQDCYDSFPAVGNGMVPSGVRVTPLPVDPHRDSIGRSCLLIAYKSSEGTVTGWVLLQDLQP